MAIASFRPKVFVSYAHEDRELKKKFDVNLNVLKKQGIIDLWTDGEIQPGDCWSTEISKAMSEAHLILFLVSNHFINSTFISEVEAPMAMERQENRQAVIIPIILNKTPGWQEEAWSGLQALPNPDKPLEDWKSYESGFAEVEEQLRKFIKNVLPKRIELPKTRQEEEAPGIRNPRAFSAVPDKASASTRALRKLRWPGLAALILLFGFAGLMMPKRDAAPPGSDSGNDKAAKSTATPASSDAGIPSELMQWLHDPKVNDQKVRVLVPKGRELYSKNGLVAAVAEPILVHAHRIEELSWEESGTRLVARNGLKWDMAITDANGSQIHEDLSLTTFFGAAEPGKSTMGRRIVVDPSRQVGFRTAGGVDAPPGFAFANTSGGRTAEMLGQHVFSPAFFTGPTGRIDAGDHLVAYEVKMGGQPVHRGLLNLVVPPAVSGLSRQEWLEAVPRPGFEVSLEPGGVIWPKKNELACELRIKGDPARLKAPVKWLCYYQACKVGEGKPESWVVDPDGMSSLERSVELRDFNWRHACWSAGGELLLKEGVAKEVIKLPAGPLGEFKAGRRDVAVELLGDGETLWRGILSLDVPSASVGPSPAKTAEPSFKASQEIDGIVFNLVKAQSGPSGLFFEFLATNNRASRAVLISFASNLIDREGRTHQVTSRRSGSLSSGGDVLEVTLPSGVPTRIELGFRTAAPKDAFPIPILNVLTWNQGTFEFRSIPEIP